MKFIDRPIDYVLQAIDAQEAAFLKAFADGSGAWQRHMLILARLSELRDFIKRQPFCADEFEHDEDASYLKTDYINGLPGRSRPSDS